MSDEQDPPPLSLRPRKKPVEDEAKSDAGSTEQAKPKLSLRTRTPAPESTGANEPEEKPELSLKPKAAEPAPDSSAESTPPAAEPVPPRAKPKLSIKVDKAEPEPNPEPAPENAPEASASAPPAAEPPPALIDPPGETIGEPPAIEAETPPVVEHRDESNPALDPAVVDALKKAKQEKPRLKLNIGKSAEPEPAKESAEAPAADAPPAPPPLPEPTHEDGPDYPPPVIGDPAQPAPETFPPPTPPPSILRAEEEDDEEDEDTDAPVRRKLRPEQRPAFKIAIVVIGLVLIGALGAGGYLVYDMLFGEPDYVPPIVTNPVQPTPPAATPAAATPGPSSVAGKLIEKAQNAVDAHTELVDETEKAGATSEESTELPSEPVSSVEPEAAPEKAMPAELQPSPAFRAWVSGAVISGVREGSSPRAFINGILVKQGDVLDHGFGIVFDGVDAERNLVIFKDNTGAIVGKRY